MTSDFTYELHNLTHNFLLQFSKLAQQRFDDTIAQSLENVGRHIAERSAFFIGRLFDLHRRSLPNQPETGNGSSFADPDKATTVHELLALLDRVYAMSGSETPPDASFPERSVTLETHMDQFRFRSVNIVRRAIVEAGKRLVEAPAECVSSPYFIIRGVLVVC